MNYLFLAFILIVVALKRVESDCGSCNSEDLAALNGNGNAFWQSGDVVQRGDNGCSICGWSCNASSQMAVFEVLGTDLTTRIFYADDHCGFINNDDFGIFECSAAGIWQFTNADRVYGEIGKITCNRGDYCMPTLQTDSDTLPTDPTPNCASCNSEDLAALNGNGNAFWNSGDVVQSGDNGCSICGWSCNASNQMAVLEVLATDLTWIFYSEDHCGFINNDNFGRFECSPAGVWQFQNADGVFVEMGRITCNRGDYCIGTPEATQTDSDTLSTDPTTTPTTSTIPTRANTKPRSSTTSASSSLTTQILKVMVIMLTAKILQTFELLF